MKYLICVCFQQYYYQSIISDINECQSHPCMNNATCNDLINTYNCSCVPGYVGYNCERGNIFYFKPFNYMYNS